MQEYQTCPISVPKLSPKCPLEVPHGRLIPCYYDIVPKLYMSENERKSHSSVSGSFYFRKGEGVMKLAYFEIRLTTHAYERYCERVGPINRTRLTELIQEQMQEGYQRKKGYVEIDGVWWRAEISNGIITLHTCYGRTHIDIPEAVRWAKRNKDRIALGDGLTP